MRLCRRRGIHSLVAVSMLIGFTIIFSGMLFAVLADYVDVATSNTQCVLSGVSLYNVGDRAAYLVMTLHNLGSHAITLANVTFTDDNNTSHGFHNSTVDIAPGDTWSKMDTFVALLTTGDKYAVRASVMDKAGSIAECSGVYVKP